LTLFRRLELGKSKNIFILSNTDPGNTRVNAVKWLPGGEGVLNRCLVREVRARRWNPDLKTQFSDFIIPFKTECGIFRPCLRLERSKNALFSYCVSMQWQSQFTYDIMELLSDGIYSVCIKHWTPSHSRSSIMPSVIVLLKLFLL